MRYPVAIETGDETRFGAWRDHCPGCRADHYLRRKTLQKDQRAAANFFRHDAADEVTRTGGGASLGVGLAQTQKTVNLSVKQNSTRDSANSVGQCKLCRFILQFHLFLDHNPLILYVGIECATKITSIR